MRRVGTSVIRKTPLLLVLSVILVCCAGCGDDGAPVSPDQNRTPLIDSVTVSADTVLEADTVSIEVHASDPDGDAITYWFYAAAGAITIDRNEAEWIAPGTPGNFMVLVSVVDEHHAATSRILTITVIDRPTGISGTVSLADPAGGLDLVGARLALYTSEAAWMNDNPWYFELIEGSSPLVCNFTLEPLPVGSYYLDVWKDVNENGVRDAADLFGLYGTGTLADPELAPIVVTENEITRLGTIYAS